MKTNMILCFTSVILFSIISCDNSNTSSNDNQSDGFNGFTSANEVAKDALKAYWPLNGNGTETISSTNPETTVSTSYVTGVKGEAANFNSGYMSYPIISNLSTTSGSASISCWVKLNNNATIEGTNGTISTLFSLTRSGKTYGNLDLIANTTYLTSSKSIQMKGLYSIKKSDNTEITGEIYNNIKSDPSLGTKNIWNANEIAGTWAHVVYTYDGPSGTTKIFVNGSRISNDALEIRNSGNALLLNHFTPTKPVIGALQSIVDGTNTTASNAELKGQIDELRFYNKALSSIEIISLYSLEKAGK